MIELGLPPLRESRMLRSPNADRLTMESPAKVLPTCWSSSAGVEEVKLHDLQDQTACDGVQRTARPSSSWTVSRPNSIADALDVPELDGLVG